MIQLLFIRIEYNPMRAGHARTLKFVLGLIACLPLVSVMADDLCKMQINQPALDFGNFNAGELTSKSSMLDNASLGKRPLQLSVVCPAPAKMALTFHGLAVGSRGFSMGDLGSFTLTLRDARLDGVQVFLGQVSRTDEVPLSVQDTARLQPNSYVVPSASGRLAEGKVLTVTVEIEAQVKAEARKTRDKLVLDGDGQFEVITSVRNTTQGTL